MCWNCLVTIMWRHKFFINPESLMAFVVFDKCYFKTSYLAWSIKLSTMGTTYYSVSNLLLWRKNPAKIHLLKVNNRNSRKRCKICWKLTIKTPELPHWRRPGIFIVKFEHILHIFLCFLCWLKASKCLLGRVLV